MDPITLITTALVAGALAATKDVAGQAIRDGYTGLKTLIVRKFGDKADVAGGVEGVEKNPNSRPRQGVLKEELEKAGAAHDAEVLRQAQALLELLKAQGLAGGTSYQAELHGSGAIAQGEGAAAAGEGGLAVSGRVGGDVQVGRQAGEEEI